LRNDWRGFSNSGISIMLGHVRSRDVCVQRQRVRESLFRTYPAGVSVRWFDTITRRVYRVRGPNSFWHIDGLYCPISWRFVIHGGFDRVFRLKVVQQTILLRLGLAAVQSYGFPSRVCWDEGDENVDVERAMLWNKGLTGEDKLLGYLYTTSELSNFEEKSSLDSVSSTTHCSTIWKKNRPA